ncbi:hypothetical protein ACO1O0_003583 [Amphichorda felina]
MMFKTALALLAAATPLVSAAGYARVVNQCDFDVSLWSVGSNIDGPHTVKADGGLYGEKFRKDPVTGGIALKITREADGLYTGEPQLIYSYSLDGSRIWYDLSTVFGDAFEGHKLVEASRNTACPAIVWKNGTPPSGSQVKDCNSGDHVTLTLCA